MYQPMHVAVAAKLPTNVKLDSPLHPIANKHTRGVVATSPLSVKDVKIVLDNIRDLNTSLRNRLDTTYAKVELPVALQALAQKVDEDHFVNFATEVDPKVQARFSEKALTFAAKDGSLENVAAYKEYDQGFLLTLLDSVDGSTQAVRLLHPLLSRGVFNLSDAKTAAALKAVGTKWPQLLLSMDDDDAAALFKTQEDWDAVMASANKPSVKAQLSKEDYADLTKIGGLIVTGFADSGKQRPVTATTPKAPATVKTESAKYDAFIRKARADKSPDAQAFASEALKKPMPKGFVGTLLQHLNLSLMVDGENGKPGKRLVTAEQIATLGTKPSHVWLGAAPLSGDPLMGFYYRGNPYMVVPANRKVTRLTSEHITAYVRAFVIAVEQQKLGAKGDLNWLNGLFAAETAPIAGDTVATEPPGEADLPDENRPRVEPTTKPKSEQQDIAAHLDNRLVKLGGKQAVIDDAIAEEVTGENQGLGGILLPRAVAKAYWMRVTGTPASQQIRFNRNVPGTFQFVYAGITVNTDGSMSFAMYPTDDSGNAVNPSAPNRVLPLMQGTHPGLTLGLLNLLADLVEEQGEGNEAAGIFDPQSLLKLRSLGADEAAKEAPVPEETAAATDDVADAGEAGEGEGEGEGSYLDDAIDALVASLEEVADSIDVSDDAFDDIGLSDLNLDKTLASVLNGSAPAVEKLLLACNWDEDAASSVAADVKNSVTAVKRAADVKSISALDDERVVESVKTLTEAFDALKDFVKNGGEAGEAPAPFVDESERTDVEDVEYAGEYVDPDAAADDTPADEGEGEGEEAAAGEEPEGMGFDDDDDPEAAAQPEAEQDDGTDPRLVEIKDAVRPVIDAICEEIESLPQQENATLRAAIATPQAAEHLVNVSYYRDSQAVPYYTSIGFHLDADLFATAWKTVSPILFDMTREGKSVREVADEVRTYLYSVYGEEVELVIEGALEPTDPTPDNTSKDDDVAEDDAADLLNVGDDAGDDQGAAQGADDGQADNADADDAVQAVANQATAWLLGNASDDVIEALDPDSPVADAILEVLLMGADYRVPRVLSNRPNLYQEVLAISDDFYDAVKDTLPMLGLDDGSEGRETLREVVDAISSALADSQAAALDDANRDAGTPAAVDAGTGEDDGEAIDEQELVADLIERVTPEIEGIAHDLAKAAVANGNAQEFADAFKKVDAANWVIESGENAAFSQEQNDELAAAFPVTISFPESFYDVVDKVVPEGTFALPEDVLADAVKLSPEGLVHLFTEVTNILSDEVEAVVRQELAAGADQIAKDEAENAAADEAANNAAPQQLADPDTLREELHDAVLGWMRDVLVNEEHPQDLDASDEAMNFMNDEEGVWQKISADLDAHDLDPDGILLDTVVDALAEYVKERGAAADVAEQNNADDLLNVADDDEQEPEQEQAPAQPAPKPSNKRYADDLDDDDPFGLGITAVAPASEEADQGIEEVAIDDTTPAADLGGEDLGSELDTDAATFAREEANEGVSGESLKALRGDSDPEGGYKRLFGEDPNVLKSVRDAFAVALAKMTSSGNGLDKQYIADYIRDNYPEGEDEGSGVWSMEDEDTMMALVPAVADAFSHTFSKYVSPNMVEALHLDQRVNLEDLADAFIYVNELDVTDTLSIYAGK